MEVLTKGIDYGIKHIRHVFTVTDLQYLYRGGRLNKGTSIIGNMPKIKPLLEVNESGRTKTNR